MKNSLQIISYNVFGSPFHGERILKTFLKTKIRKRFRLIAQEINKRETDIIFFQEVHTYPHLFVLKKALSQTYKVYFQPGIFGPKGGLVTFSKLKFTKKIFIDFAEKGALWNKSVTGPLTQKGMLLLKENGSNLWFINTHLTQNSKGNWNEKSIYTKLLTSQLKQCASLVNSLKNKNYNAIIGGDFNTPATSHLYQAFLNDANVVDVFEEDTTSTFIVWFDDIKFSERLDYIFYTKNAGISVHDKKLLFTEPLKIDKGDEQLLSDHVALEVRLTLS